MKNALFIVVVCLLAMGAGYLNATAAENPVSYGALFDEVCKIVEDNFYDSDLIKKKFPLLKDKYKSEMGEVSTRAGFATKMNEMLKQLGASHTNYLTPSDYEYYQLAGVFSTLPAVKKLFSNREITCPTVGIITAILDEQVFVASVLPGGAAEKAGLLAGDQIVAVNEMEYQPVDSLKGNVGRAVDFTIRRNPGDRTMRFGLTPRLINPRLEMLEAEKASIKVITSGDRRIGYIHIYSYAGVEYHDELVDAIAWGPFKDADALIIDLRYGLGGGDPAYLNLFNKQVPVILMKDNKGGSFRFDSQWRKPAVYLTNRTSRSGKELLAFGAKKYKLATVVGERTAGAVLGGSPFPLSNGDLLYLATRSGLIDGVVLEGIGVAPDIEVPMDIRYCQGKDIQLEKAIEHLMNRLQLPEKE